MDSFTLLLSKDIIRKNKASLIDNNFVIETKLYDIVLGFSDFYFSVFSVLPKDITIPYRSFKFTVSVFSDTVSFNIYFYDL